MVTAASGTPQKKINLRRPDIMEAVQAQVLSHYRSELVERIRAELGPATKAVATGGQGGLIVRASRCVRTFDEDLTLDGLRLIWERNRT